MEAQPLSSMAPETGEGTSASSFWTTLLCPWQCHDFHKKPYYVPTVFTLFGKELYVWDLVINYVQHNTGAKNQSSSIFQGCVLFSAAQWEFKVGSQVFYK